MKVLNTISAALVILINIATTTAQAKPFSESEKANVLFDKLFDEQVKRSPEWQTYLGMNSDADQWDDISLKREVQNHAFDKAQLKQLHKLDPKKLDETTALSYQLFEKQLNDGIEGYVWRHYNYPVNQMFGVHSGIASLLINQHKIENKKDAENYIARLKNIPRLIDQLIEGLKAREAEKIIAPKFVYPKVISDCENLIKGLPFTDGEESPLLADFKKKISTLDLTDKEKTTLTNNANQALLGRMRPAYQKLIVYLKGLETRANTDDGVWKFPNGDAYYNFALQRTTTTNMSADDIHQLGLSEVARIHTEMKSIMTQVNFKGDLRQFFDYLLKDPQFYYPNTPDGKQAYLKKATEIIDTMKGQLDRLFLVKPKADLIVKAVEPFRENSAGKAFYDAPAPGGTRPGTYYVNLYDMASLPNYEMEALAYHEGIPGHHMQISIAQEMETMPKFRKYGHYTAYVEGWGLYAEQIPKESGFYENPYSDFGRLNLELWRACRLVLDTGIHAKHWSREQGVAYLMENTPISQEEAYKAIDRYIVMPSQATAYKIGMMKILQLRAKAKTEFGEKFDIREFHNVVLKNGAVPLDILEQLVENWIKLKKNSDN